VAARPIGWWGCFCSTPALNMIQGNPAFKKLAQLQGKSLCSLHWHSTSLRISARYLISSFYYSSSGKLGQ